MDTVTITLTPQEAVDVVNIIGQLPTQANAYPLFVKIKNQVVSQQAPATPAPAPTTPAEPAQG
jgi:hypothetical protein